MRSARVITQAEAAIVMTLVIPNSNMVMSNREPTTRVMLVSDLKELVSPDGIEPHNSKTATNKMMEANPITTLANFFFVEADAGKEANSEVFGQWGI